VQQILEQNGRNGGVEVRNSYGSLLKGLMRCASCDAGMVRTYTIRDSNRVSLLRLRASASKESGQLRIQAGL
jgi:hypothetical protein